ncbi:biosynthetic arginine decarboxylase [Synechococcus sp. CS-1325]|uniref:biosynthetic arginine decarboxylase n=1 Tax=unclassified Synechococcus TaxID=2626047 RepID=UPI000DB4E2FF|nr:MULTISPECIES: biosynthetic arginine decarboxylase [unclassified Synechococcus]MCT0200093.1 biosynthetic arginine decarboxylase [Synechococcus sp. CS-1325]MCT0230332.1 biosynthetic arginine decarboxylase [Synechococcus sp. CS-1324]PZV00580.1 MAG: arginine decarboxylase [Cyanobium sp.]PZV03962.1 MAG: arginine decarboxylase [Cyanobium sp.]
MVLADPTRPPGALPGASAPWSVADSTRLYGLEGWGEPYFSANGRGHVMVQPRGDRGGSLDLVDLVEGLQSRDLSLPLLIRFDDILEDRLERLHAAFERAIAQYGYAGRYQGVFPVKCNQQRHVVEQLVESGRRWHFGLEAGSKAELLIALSLVDDPEALLICNGYKDQRYIETAILARRLGRQPVVVIEQADEVERIIAASASLGAAPLIGVRAKLSARSSGRWGSSVGERAKFGLSIPDLLTTVERLRAEGLLGELRLLHFHVGSQINDIAVIKDALQEAGQIYVQLAQLGAPMGYLDVGGGLGIDYDGSRTATAASTNYSLQNYANDVVATVRECCEPLGVALPTLVSESGRALASHFSVLVFDVLGASGVPDAVPEVLEGEPLIVRNLRDTLAVISATEHGDTRPLQEAWNDALKFKEDALSAFRLGYLSLPERAMAEQLTWACCQSIAQRLPTVGVPDQLKGLQAALATTYYANLSVFRSAPDTWAIDQLFPVMPIHRLDERPSRLGSFADLTCDSDGKLARFIDGGQVKPLLELHAHQPGEPYWIGLFLGGAYQEVMGNLHNLFGSTNAVHIRLAAAGGYRLDHVVRGDTNADVLKAMEHQPELLLERLRVASEAAISSGDLRISDAQRLMAHLKSSLGQITYLQ